MPIVNSVRFEKIEFNSVVSLSKISPALENIEVIGEYCEAGPPFIWPAFQCG